MDTEKIMGLIPYGKDFLMIDKAEIISEDMIKAEKYIKKDNPYLKDHFTSFAIMPGVLILEAMGQSAALLLTARFGKENYYLAYEFSDARFKRPAMPGTMIRYSVKMTLKEGRFTSFRGEAHDEKGIVAEADFVLAIVYKQSFEEKHRVER